MDLYSLSVSVLTIMYIYIKGHLLTCSESPSHLHTLVSALCRHNVVVVGVSFQLLSEGGGGILIHCGQGVLISQVGVGWVCTILNSAVIPSLKNAHPTIALLGSVESTRTSRMFTFVPSMEKDM